MAKVQVAEPTVSNEVASKTPRHRSPNYPSIGLRKAVEQISKFYETYKRASVPVLVAYKHLGFSASNSVAGQRIAAYKGYGLMDVHGAGNKAEVRISDRAYKILLNHADRDTLLRESALAPAIHKDLWTKYTEHGLPPDDVIRQHLVFEKSFNPASVDGFIAQFRDTIAFAKLDSSGKMAVDSPKDDKPEIGDLVQWESQGQDQFAEPRRVTSVSDCGGWIFVEGSLTAMPADQVRLVERASEKPEDDMNPAIQTPQIPPPPPPAATRTPPSLRPGMREAKMPGQSGGLEVKWMSPITYDECESYKDFLDMLKKTLDRDVKTEPLEKTA